MKNLMSLSGIMLIAFAFIVASASAEEKKTISPLPSEQHINISGCKIYLGVSKDNFQHLLSYCGLYSKNSNTKNNDMYNVFPFGGRETIGHGYFKNDLLVMFIKSIGLFSSSEGVDFGFTLYDAISSAIKEWGSNFTLTTYRLGSKDANGEGVKIHYGAKYIDILSMEMTLNGVRSKQIQIDEIIGDLPKVIK